MLFDIYAYRAANAYSAVRMKVVEISRLTILAILATAQMGKSRTIQHSKRLSRNRNRHCVCGLLAIVMIASPAETKPIGVFVNISTTSSI